MSQYRGFNIERTGKTRGSHLIFHAWSQERDLGEYDAYELAADAVDRVADAGTGFRTVKATELEPGDVFEWPKGARQLRATQVSMDTHAGVAVEARTLEGHQVVVPLMSRKARVRIVGERR